MAVGWRQRLQRLDAFNKMDSVYQDRSSAGGFLSVLVVVSIILMIFGELQDYLQYKQVQTFSIDSDMRHPLQINIAMAVAMPCALIRVDILDISGTSQNVHSAIELQPVLSKDAFGRTRGQRRINSVGEMHVHDILAEAAKKHRQQGGLPKGLERAKRIDRLEDAACYIEGSVMVGKVAGLLHVTAYGHGHGGAYVPHRMMNFTHHIDELSFGPLYPNLANPLDNTMHPAYEHFAAFSYFISVLPTVYIDPFHNVLQTNQYAANEYYRSRINNYDLETKPPGIFFEYDIESIAITVREKRDSLLSFIVRICAATSGIFATVGIGHRLISGLSRSFSGRLSNKSNSRQSTLLEIKASRLKALT
ncbi:hypothetical protein GGI15_000091 [Coemansia interrupta]|uniref:Uncharacterized protein n=1 Tax=Coemansia interrupta TaxID=1126814 RepID=A0A9W8LNV9_9FUNG|nr:hypothetical protein GGI15_000091 [Coemansia interrupta]